MTPAPPTAPAIDLTDRPFGVHFRMARWKSLIVLVAVPLLLLVVQILVFQIVVLVEGPPDPRMPRLTPLAILAAGVSTAITALVATVLVARLAKVSWRSVFRRDRTFDKRRLGAYLVASAVLVGLSVLATALIAPGSTGWGALDISTTTIVVILVTLLATPLQAAGEEVAFRGVVVPAAASWFRAVRPAIALGIVVSGALFAVVHVSLDPWLVSYLFVFSACTVIMGLLSGGLEAAIAFHVSNNVIAGIVNAVFADGGAATIDRAVGAGPGPSLIILMVMNVAVVIAVWLIERRRRP
ncbi:CPBP family intramembrane metalloprotease [Herbiconiux sp. CPCC 203407]|uniref:CPBP family intramembrane metalloprotease n=1 Tax=Herbiconiux oxytropis TaxID=2970915 RepID=A0AA41XAA2_9MICO|nr:CPBP family intramembrane glutamic endopeptidase [Herbiconiux oxytropis]MCS5721477.1 CPBP family intramembrane metalloprotease [Herbiconiux oxytropis]MCS5724554.1 CPBP family intramembrane metalloprotease [Herbiconiux oxytropis]